MRKGVKREEVKREEVKRKGVEKEGAWRKTRRRSIFLCPLLLSVELTR